jgi:NPCBM/NEW2 domain
LNQKKQSRRDAETQRKTQRREIPLWLSLRLCVSAVAFVFFMGGITFAGTWNLTDSRFVSRVVSVESIDGAGIHLSSGVVPWDDVLEISQATGAAGDAGEKFSVVSRGGDVLGGEPISLNGDTLDWRSGRVGEIGFGIDSVMAIVRSGVAVGDLDQARTDDVVRLANGDSTHGIITQIGSGGVTIQAGDATPTLAWDSISAVLFSSGPANPRGAEGRMFRVELGGDEALTVPDVALAGDKVTVFLTDKSSRSIDVGSVVGIEQVNGPISWLTAYRPSENIYKPFLSENFPTRFDRTVADGKPIRERYPAFHHGIGCHSYSKLVYDLTGKWGAFRSQFAIDSDSPLADVTVRIYLDDKVVFERKNVKAGRVYPVVTIPLAGVKSLGLEVDYGENYATEDRFVWLDPALIRKAGPTTAP